MSSKFNDAAGRRSNARVLANLAKSRSKAPALPVCTRCNATCKPDGMGAGYGRNLKGETLCYECCAENDRETMRRGEPITLYTVNHKPYNASHPKGAASCEVINWPGTLRLQGFSQPRRHNMSRDARSVWAWFEGRQWYGMQGGGGDYVTLRPTKTTTAKLNRK